MELAPITCLPVELLTRILSLLSFQDIAACSCLSRHFLELVESSTTLQYILELGSSGLVDSGRGSLTTGERLVRLREHEDVWSTLSWRHSSNIPVGKKYIFWELCGGIFSGSYKSPNSPFSGRCTFDMIDIFKIESPSATHPAETIPLNGRFCNYSVDPGQDLLILVEEPPYESRKVWVMHIRCLSDTLVHPSATSGTIEVPVAHEKWDIDDQNDPGVVETQILGNTVLFCQRRGPGLAGSISVFNWHTGKMNLMILPTLGDWDCALISWKHLLLSQRPFFADQPRLELYDIHQRHKLRPRRITYFLPFGSDKKWRTKACYGPASYSLTSSTPVGTLRPFVPSCQPLLLAFRYIRPPDASGVADLRSSLDMFLIPSKLLKYGQTNDEVEWEEWGPQSTRWFRGVLPNKWRRNIQGFRAALPEKNIVLDFNPRNRTDDEGDLITQSSHLPSDDRGFKGIVSYLPYRMLQPCQPFASNNVLLDGQFVCVETDAHEVDLVKALHVLSF